MISQYDYDKRDDEPMDEEDVDVGVGVWGFDWRNEVLDEMQCKWKTGGSCDGDERFLIRRWP